MNSTFKEIYNIQKFGAYHALRLSEESCETVCDLQKELSKFLKTKHDADDFHCTLMYSKVGKVVQPKTNLVYECAITGVANYNGYLVLTLESDMLNVRHEELKYEGLVYSYDTYNPHITIGELKDDVELPDFIEKRNVVLVNEYREPLDE